MPLLLLACAAFVETQYEAAGTEAPANLDFIRTAELGRAAAGQPLVACEGAGCEALGWPSGGLRGKYWVEVHSSGFTAHGEIDVDGDGVPARWVATEGEAPRALTPPEVR